MVDDASVLGAAPEESRFTPVYSQLATIDWTFATAPTRGATHGIHPYPAKFIPQVPRELIRALHPNDGTAVLDPFCGSGTTLVEAGRFGVPAVGVDLHPLACLISKVKVTPLAVSLIDAAEATLARARSTDDSPPDIPALDHWFTPEIQRSLAALTRAIDEEGDGDVRDALRVALSSIIVRVSNQESDTRYAAIEKNVSAADVWSGFRDSARNIEQALRATWGGLFPRTPVVTILNRDVLGVRREDVQIPVSLVVTSPPYPNAYEYWLYHKYRMLWLGMDPIAVRQREIGARPHYFKREPQTADDFERQMTKVFSLLWQLVVPGGHTCFQIGNSIIHGQPVDNVALVTRAAERSGFRSVLSAARRIPTTRKAFNPRNSRIQDERVLVFAREGQ